MNLRIKLLIVFSIFFVIFTLLVFSFVNPLFSRVRTHSQDFLEIKKDLANLVEKDRLLPSIKKDYDVLMPRLGVIENLFIDAQAPIDFLNSLEETARSSGILIDISLLGVPSGSKESAKNETVDSLNFKVVALGSFSDCLRFVSKVERLPYLVTIESMSIIRLTETQLKSVKYQEYSAGDVEFILSLKVLTKKMVLASGF